MSLVDCLLHAVEGHKNYPGKVDCKLCFFNMQAHPLLESKHHIDGELIMSNFIAML